MKIGDLVRYININKPSQGVGVVVEVREKAGIGKVYHVMWASGKVMAHSRHWLLEVT